ncbi:MAG: TonB-dependent receptor [Sphingomonadales bacterium]|nr:TonB-dependent receptor [Sphingomonadales bacterium]
MSAPVTAPVARLLRSSAFAALAIAAAVPARAATDDTAAADTVAADADADADAVSEIVVTARHRSEDVQSVPVAISVVNEASLEKTGNFTIAQAVQQIPSLQVVNTNPRNTNITIRGLGANSALAVDGLEYGVGFYLDGVYYGRPGQSQFDLVDLQQIEVLRGPQGTLFGKNTTAGAINITSKEPSFTPELTAEGSLGNWNYHQLRVSGSIPLSDTVAVRLTVADTHRDGFLTNVFDQSKAEDYDNFSIRGQLLWKPSADVKVRLIGDYSRQNQHYILNVYDGIFTKYANGTTIANNIVDRLARFGLAPANFDFNAFDRLGNSNSHYQANMKSYGVSGEVDYDLGGATLTAITAYRWWDWYPANDGDSLPLSVNLKAQQQNFQRQFSQELRVASSGRHFIDWQAGLYYFWQKVPGYGATQYGRDFALYNLPAATPPAALNNVANALTNLEVDSYSNSRTKSYAAFGQVDVHLAEPLTLTAGLRFTHEDKSGEYSRYLAPGSAGDRTLLTAAQQAQFQVSDLAFTTALKADALSGLVTLGYKVTPDALIYATYSRGNKSGGLNITAGGAGHTQIKPEKVDAFEIGIKSEPLDHTLTANLAAFHTRIHDYQANISVPIGGTTTFIQYIDNIPSVRSQGVEGDLAWAPSKWVSLNASIAYTDAKYLSYANAPIAPENSIPGTPQVQDLSGKRLPGVSKFAYSLGVDLARPVGGDFEAYLHADWLHRSSFNSTATNSIYGVVPAYGLLNGRIGLRTANGRFDFSLWARNLTNRNYYISRSPGNFGLITAAVGDPRTFGATFRAKL